MSGDKCEQCGRLLTVMIGMQPGSDGGPWLLCIRCWIEGLRKLDGSPIVPIAPVETPAPPRKSRKAS